MITFIFLLSLPLVFLLPNLNKNIWDDVLKDNLVKHELLAKGLLEPIRLRILLYQNSLSSLGTKLQKTDLSNFQKARHILQDFTNQNEDVVAVTLISNEKGLVTTTIKNSFQLSSRYQNQTKDLEYVLTENKYRLHDTKNSISSVFKSTISTQPAILFRQHIITENGNKLGTLIAEIGLGFMKKICGQISFGNKGHCAIVDNEGKVIAHPNASWVSKMQNLSRDDIVKKLKRSGSGTLDYFSAINNEAMIGGFAKVDGLDWGVMVLQPKTEIDSPFDGIKVAIISWVAVGVLSALLIAFFVTRVITRPLNTLVDKARELDVRSESYRLGEVPRQSPIEIKVLWNQLAKLIVDFQEANNEVKSLSGSLSKDLRKVVAELRENNLKKSRNRDLLTGITNRECFAKELGKSLLIHKGEDVGIILIDVNNYQQLVTNKGQEAGNQVLKHVASIFCGNIRSGDMAVRYDNADRFAVYINYSNPESLQGTADKLCSLVESNPIIWKDESIYITVSMGLVIREIDENLTVDLLMAQAENALDAAKTQGQQSAHVA